MNRKKSTVKGDLAFTAALLMSGDGSSANAP